MTPSASNDLRNDITGWPYGASLRQHLQTPGNAYQAEGNDGGAKI